jgi:hypothetical protein
MVSVGDSMRTDFFVFTGGAVAVAALSPVAIIASSWSLDKQASIYQHHCRAHSEPPPRCWWYGMWWAEVRRLDGSGRERCGTGSRTWWKYQKQCIVLCTGDELAGAVDTQDRVRRQCVVVLMGAM